MHRDNSIYYGIISTTQILKAKRIAEWMEIKRLFWYNKTHF